MSFKFRNKAKFASYVKIHKAGLKERGKKFFLLTLKEG